MGGRGARAVLPGRWRGHCCLSLAPGVELATKGISCSSQLMLSFNRLLAEHLLSARPCPRWGRYCDETRSAKSWLSKARFTVGEANGIESKKISKEGCNNEMCYKEGIGERGPFRWDGRGSQGRGP